MAVYLALALSERNVTLVLVLHPTPFQFNKLLRMSDYQEKLVPAKESRGSSLASFPSSLSMDFSEATIPLESFRTRSRLLLNRIFASLKKKQVYKFVAILLLVTCVTVLSLSLIHI